MIILNYIIFNLSFKNSTNLDLFSVVYLQSSELNSEIFRSHIFFSCLIDKNQFFQGLNLSLISKY